MGTVREDFQLEAATLRVRAAMVVPVRALGLGVPGGDSAPIGKVLLRRS